MSHVYTAVCKTLSVLPPNAGLTSPRRGDESRDDDAFGGPMRGSDARKVLAALASVTRSLQRTYVELGGRDDASRMFTTNLSGLVDDPPRASMQNMCRTSGFLDDLVNMAVTPINLGLDIRFQESDLEMSEKNVSGPIRLKGDAELEALAAEATDRAGERKIATREERLLNQPGGKHENV